MSKSFKVVAFLAVTAMILASPVFGQTSNTSNATAGVFTSDVDDSMSVHDYSNVEFGKWFGFIGFGGTVQSVSGSPGNDYQIDLPLQLGFATRFGGSEGEGEEGEAKSGGLYLGLFYAGNMLSIEEDWTQVAVRAFDPISQQQTDKSTITDYSSAVTARTNTISSNNELQALIGVAGMGFRVRFAEDVKETTWPDRTITVTEDAGGVKTHTTGDIVDYTNIVGTLSPAIQWGMHLDAGSIKIRPLVTAAFTIGLDKETNDRRIPGGGSYTTVNGEVVGTDDVYSSGFKAGYFTPSINVGAGIDFENFSLDVGYGIGFPIYKNKYDVAGFKGTAGIARWGYDDPTSPGDPYTLNTENHAATTTSIATTAIASDAIIDITDYKSYLTHDIRLGFLTDKEVAEGLQLGLNAGADFIIESYVDENYVLTLNRNETRQNNGALSYLNTKTEQEIRGEITTTNFTELSIKPYVNIGASYALVPNRLTVNAGVAMRPCEFTNTVTRTSTQNDTVTKDRTYTSGGDLLTETVTTGGDNEVVDGIDVVNKWNYFGVDFGAGFVFNFTEKMTLDTFVGISDTFDLNIFNFNVLFSVKF